MPSLLNRQAKSIDERYFAEIRPKLYENHGKHYQYGSRKGKTLAEHLDSACQFVLTVTKMAKVDEEKRGKILSATAVHDLNKLDETGRNVKQLARNREFLTEQLEKACVIDLVKTEEDFELVRRLIERHSGHSASDGMRFLPEDENIEKWSAMLIGADLFDLGISESERIRKVENELTVALGRVSNLFKVTISEDRGYLTSLLLGACEDVLTKYNLTPLAIFPDGELFEGKSFPEHDLTPEIAQIWQQKINRVFGGNIEQLVKATTSGIKIDDKAINQDLEETLIQVQALLEKKKASYKADKLSQDINKHGGKAGEEAILQAKNLSLIPVSNDEEFAISEGLKAIYVSYGKKGAGLTPEQSWQKIYDYLNLSPEKREVLKLFDALYGRCLFAVKAVNNFEEILTMLKDSFEMRKKVESSTSQVSEEMIKAVAKILNLPQKRTWQGQQELNAYIEANPRKRCSLGNTSMEIQELISREMPPETKVQSFSNRLPGGISAEPKRQGDSISALAYQLMAVGANFPNSAKQEPLYLHFALPQGSSPELLRIWRYFLERTTETNGEWGTVSVDETKLYRDNEMDWKANKVVGFAFPKRPDFIHSTVILPVLWGDVNNSVALLKSLRLALEISLAVDFGFPFILSNNLEIETTNNYFARVEGIPSSLQPLLSSGEYQREGHLSETERKINDTAEKILTRLRCLGEIVFIISSPKKWNDCLYELACTAKKPLDYYFVILRWILREKEDPNFEYFWGKICQPLFTLLDSLMPNEHQLLTQYLKEAAHLAEVGKLRGSSFKRTSQVEPFAEFLKAIRSRKSHLDWDVVFASLTQEYHNRLDRIREHGVGANKYEQIKEYYQVLRKIFEEIYQCRPEKILSDKKTLESAYLFFLQEARQELKQKD
ncbi:CRISPR-associated protein Csc3 [Cyanobacterium stanieri LEGE 03274]|uniref:CRISPR-associated protein Csc3 n=1 Tax=Cyanobacterium stanieri LEGE 03274 TaxID=1828756 RepID=A0ABR9V3C8_9CHRO|nr:CRISPR-associated protein Csc3 [Cyanobacterium stanieri]MBE9222403.1 CRISPR-associated protein Csc3 [Cyanobacterium stanieri LEGE 03274]